MENKKNPNDLVDLYDDTGLNFLDDLGDDFDYETKRKVFNEYLNDIKQKTGKDLDINELGDTYHRENVFNLLSKNKQPKTAFDPLSEDNLESLFDKHNSNEDAVLDEIREQISQLESDPENPISNGDIQGIVEAFALQRGSSKPIKVRGK